MNVALQLIDKMYKQYHYRKLPADLSRQVRQIYFKELPVEFRDTKYLKAGNYNIPL